MENYLQIGNTKVNYLVKRSNRKTVELVIDLNEGFLVKAPNNLSDNELVEKLRKKSKWIINNLDKMSEILENTANSDYTSGEKKYYLGRRYKIRIHQKKDLDVPYLDFKNRLFNIYINKNIDKNDYPRIIRPLFINFYKQKSLEVIEKRIKKYLKYYENKPKSIKIKDFNDKWGSCSKANMLSFNWRIILSSMKILDYVVVHELSHMKYKNHSEKYWNLVQSVIPDYKERKDWLRINADILKI
jgi:hypothetical protein